VNEINSETIDDSEWFELDRKSLILKIKSIHIFFYLLVFLTILLSSLLLFWYSNNFVTTSITFGFAFGIGLLTSLSIFVMGYRTIVVITTYAFVTLSSAMSLIVYVGSNPYLLTDILSVAFVMVNAALGFIVGNILSNQLKSLNEPLLISDST